MSGLRVVIADDEPLVRQGLRMVLEFDGDLSVVAEAADGRQALAHMAEHRPDLALLDIRMPGIVAAVLRKLELRDRTQAAVAAYELGLVRPGEAD